MPHITITGSPAIGFRREACPRNGIKAPSSSDTSNHGVTDEIKGESLIMPRQRNWKQWKLEIATLAVAMVLVLFALLYHWLFDPYVEWREEVKLNDGRIIVIEQKRRDEGGVPREAWVTIDAPIFGSSPITWHENLRPIILNVDKGNLYVVGTPPTRKEALQYECVSPYYIGFRWVDGKWEKIPFSDIPEAVYDVDLLLPNFPPKDVKILTLERKDKKDLNGDPARKAAVFSKINRQAGSGC